VTTQIMVPEEVVGEDSGAVLIQDVHIQAETVVVDALLGGNGAHADVAEARPSDTIGGETSAPVRPGST
jgi:hypothetical protein